MLSKDWEEGDILIKYRIKVANLQSYAVHNNSTSDSQAKNLSMVVKC